MACHTQLHAQAASHIVTMRRSYEPGRGFTSLYELCNFGQATNNLYSPGLILLIYPMGLTIVPFYWCSCKDQVS